LNLFEARGLTVRSQDPGTNQTQRILQNFSFSVPENKTSILQGPSGFGKTTFAKTLAGLLPENIAVTEGTLLYRGEPILYKQLKKKRGAGVFYFPQEATVSLNPVKKIGKQLRDTPGRTRSKHDPADILEQMKFRDPRELMKAYPHQLSEGENRLCILTMAILAGPELLILDEPVTSLDDPTKKKFLELLEHYEFPTLLVITHSKEIFENRI